MPSLRSNLSTLIGQIYEAAVDPTGWRDFLHLLSEHTNAEQAAIFAHDEHHHQYAVGAQYGIDPEYQRMYTQHFGDLDAWYLFGKDKLLPGVVEVGQELCSDQQMVRTEFYNDCLRRFDIFHQCGGQIEGSGSAKAFLTLLRSRRHGAFGKSEKIVLRELMPHLQRGLRLHRKFIDLQIRNITLELTLNRVPEPIFLLGVSKQLVFANAAGENLLRQGDIIALRKGKLICVNQDETSSRLSEILDRAIEISTRKNVRSANSSMLVQVRGQGQERFIRLTVAPLGAQLPLYSSAVAAVFVQANVGQELPFGFEGCNLTMAERRIAQLVVSGQTLKEAANALHVSKNTVRTHLHRIFAKTGARRQADLVRLAMQSTYSKNHPIG